MQKKKVSIITIALCTIVVIIICSALIVSVNKAKENNTGIPNESVGNDNNVGNVNRKTYTLKDVQEIAKQAYVNNYLAYNQGDVTMAEFEDLIINEMKSKIVASEMQKYNIFVYSDGITVESK